MAVLKIFAPRRAPRKKNARKILEEQKLMLPGTDLCFLFQRDGCRTLRMAVKSDGSICVKAPAGLPIERVFSFMTARIDWVRRKRDFFVSHQGMAAPVRDGTTVLYLSRPFLIRPVCFGKNVRARLYGHTLELPCLRPKADAETNAKALERAFLRWQKDTARLVLGKRLTRMERRARAVFGDDARVSSLTVRSLRRRWGSCSVRGEITLAAQLIAMPLPLIDYVLCHELCHLRAMNHGPGFHTLLRMLLPDADEREKRIRIWGLEHPR